MMNYKHISVVGGMLLSPLFAWSQNNKPNIIFIMCDDMGYGDLACYGQKFIRTPHIDNMAKEGMRFTQAYAGSPVSAPSRASLMTGQHTGHTEVRGNKEYWKEAARVMYGKNEEFELVGQHPYSEKHILLPEIMKDNGYNTGMFGKWAGGYEGSVSTPDKRGVDEFYGYICQFQAHSYYPNFLNRYSKKLGDKGVVRVIMEDNIKYPMVGDEYFNRPQYASDIIHHKALEWIDNQTSDKPFFGLLTYTLPHAELVQPQDSIVDEYKSKFTEDKSYKGDNPSRYHAINNTRAQFAAMITRLDLYVGEIISKLKEKGLDENTLIIFTSDNGPHEEGGADPDFFGRDGVLKGRKRSCHEGGIRVPFIARWPQKIEPNTVNDHILAFYDVMPTFCDIIGVKNMKKKYSNPNVDKNYFDGISFAPTMLGEGIQKQHKFLYWEFNETRQLALRMGDWKMIVKNGKIHLYNLAVDIHEDNDVADKYPKIVRKMKKIMYSQHIPSNVFLISLPK